jgi:ZipA, C-terminal FtsZ-binding domain
MDTLSITLIVVAAVGLASVIAFNWWSQRSAGRPAKASGADQPASGHQGTRSAPRESSTLDLGDKAVDAGRVEPRLDTSHAEPNQILHPADSDQVSQSGQLTGIVVSELVDLVIDIELPGISTTDRLMSLLQGWRRVGSKPLFLFSLPPQSNDWQELAAGAQTQALRIVLQLANRRGALNAMEYSEFVSALDKLGEPLGVLIDPPEMGQVLTKARSADAQMLALDAVIGLNVVFDHALTPADLITMAQANSLSERGSERWAKIDNNQQVIFSMSLGDKPELLSLLIDLPRASVANNPWPALLACARQLCEGFGGRLLDDQGRVLSEASLQAITEQVHKRQTDLIYTGIEPGSELALRIFN